MNELSSIKAQSDLNSISLSDQTKFRLNEISKIMDYFNSERKTISKKLSKYIAAFDYCYVYSSCSIILFLFVYSTSVVFMLFYHLPKSIPFISYTKVHSIHFI